MRILMLLLFLFSFIEVTGQEFTVYDADNGFVDDAVTTLFTDSQGRVWIGTASSGTYMMEDGEFIHHEYYTNGIAYNIFEGEATDFAEDSEGNIWIGVSDIDHGGIYKFDGTDVHLEYATTEILTSWVRAIFIDTLHDDELWVACRTVSWDEDEGGLQIFKEDTVWIFNEGFGNAPNLSFISDIKANLQAENVGLAGGGTRYVELDFDGNFNTPSVEDFNEFDNSYIKNIEYGGLHDIWLASHWEVLYYDEGLGWGAYNGENKPSGNEIECIYKDQDGAFWSYSKNDSYDQFYIDKLVDTTWVNVGILDRNVSSFVYPFRLTDDHNNNLWMALRDGIAKLPKPNATSTEVVQTNILSVYPNPANNILRIESDKGVNYTLYYSNGQEVAKGIANEIDTSHLDDGLYFLQIENQITQKIIIQH